MSATDQTPPGIHLVLDNIRSAYNVGAMFRTADAGAAAHLHLCGMSAHPPHPKLDKTALGAQDHVPWTYHERVGDALAGLRDAGFTVVAVENTPEATSCYGYPWPERLALVLGNEVHGITPRTLRKCDAAVFIPMLGYKNSVNVATALGIVLFEALRARGALAGGVRGVLAG